MPVEDTYRRKAHRGSKYDTNCTPFAVSRGPAEEATRSRILEGQSIRYVCLWFIVRDHLLPSHSTIRLYLPA